MNRATTQTFDNLGRVLTVTNPANLTVTNVYDEMGQQVRSWNSMYANDKREITYDRQGRVVRTREIGGDITLTAYAWDGGMEAAGTGLTDVGGWVRTVTGEGYSAAYKNDLFGRDADARYDYDVAGRLVLDRGIVNNAQYDDFGYVLYNTGLIWIKIDLIANTQIVFYPFPQESGITLIDGKSVAFTYDVIGRLKTEVSTDSRWQYSHMENTWATFTEYGDTYQDGEAEYDALGRMTRYRDKAAFGLGEDDVDKTWKYDANGNVRSINTNYRPMDAAGVISSVIAPSQTFFYSYDALNRIVVSKGEVSNGVVVAGQNGIALSYDVAGQRKTSKTGSGPTEEYNYTNLGLVDQVKIGGLERSTSSFDSLGRMIGYIEKDAGGTTIYDRHSFVYNSRNQVLSEKSRQKQGADWRYIHTVNYFNDAGASAVGNFPAALNANTVVDNSNSTGSLLYYTQTKAWLNGAAIPVYGSVADNNAPDPSLKSFFSFSKERGWQQLSQQTANQPSMGNSTFYYGDDGNLEKVERSNTNGSTNNSVDKFTYYFTDISGQVVESWEKQVNYTGVLPLTRTYRFGGKEMGTISNDGTENVDYNTLISRHATTPGTGYFRNGASTATTFADFDANHRTLGSGAQGGGPGSHVVQAGETLQGIAAAFYGDANLWYKIAEANGISGGALAAASGSWSRRGSTIPITTPAPSPPMIPPAPSAISRPPAQYRPRGTNAALSGGITGGGGDWPLRLAWPDCSWLFSNNRGVRSCWWSDRRGSGCRGGISIVSQGVGLATGIQDKFSWKSVGLAALGGAVGGGVKFNAFGATASDFLQTVGNAAVNGAASSAITQGIATVTGLQESFSWAGVAAAGVAAGVGARLGRGLTDITAQGGLTAGNIAAHTAVGAASLIASAATRSAIEGSSFGANIRAGLPDVIGQVLGRALVGAVQGGGGSRMLSPDPAQVERLAKAATEGASGGAKRWVEANAAAVGGRPNSQAAASLGEVVSGAISASGPLGSTAGSAATVPGSGLELGRAYVADVEDPQTMGRLLQMADGYLGQVGEYLQSDGRLFSNHGEIADAFIHKFGELAGAGGASGHVSSDLILALADTMDDIGLPNPLGMKQGLFGTVLTGLPAGDPARDVHRCARCHWQSGWLAEMPLGFKIPRAFDGATELAIDSLKPMGLPSDAGDDARSAGSDAALHRLARWYGR